MIRRRGKLRRGLTMLAVAVPSIGGFARALWQGGSGKRWLVPLVVVLCASGLLLMLASSVEALAPFIYSIF
jgi:hypothetical protein